MDERDKRLLNLIQEEFPLTSRPFEALGLRLDLTEAEVRGRISDLKRQKIIRQIGGIFDTRSLGYASSLVAMRVSPERVDEAAAVVSAHPGVSHNYQRNHAFNLWFTLAVPSTCDLGWTVERLHETAGGESTRLLPTLRLFKIGVRLDMEGKSGAERVEPSRSGYSEASRPKAGKDGVTPLFIGVCRELQEDLPLLERPYAPMAQRIGIPESRFIEVAGQMQSQGYLRRMAAVLHHQAAGYRANAMGVWVVPPERAEEVGQVMGSFRGVSHCYLRPTYPDWPYNIFTMVHGLKAEDCQEIIDAISAATGITDYSLLYSTKQYKKIRLKYFTPELDEWEERERRSLAPLAAASARSTGRPA
jgi:siroheme decarboxylase